ncbi:hypothetical protein TBLA_0B00350 [Henningerozyma blattae CBS 6284]|uniref:2,4-dienoyl-CoA reductase [(3E)-enoyl-CoA-producing] n=1 Tax=Henningerozyma blattae (strain ATCC 34711 / CBS 6284 / DSM 70876 / NBRC 10599 / NRRL Y-10934 / UCD 77-7) TaxID=1071380 RepID=I2GXM8_HENB6|nr:hypothetical protein TBLA_0B00350 [Tetrapisispora blattae CBS 6284]CCH58880.1 hypothetical protein TBLA_0B00350 [Tetrapisispora blattae CBS 6284]
MPNTITTDYLNTTSFKPNLFQDKVVLVTGGAGTICRVQTEAMVILGCKAAIMGRDVEKTDEIAKEIGLLYPDQGFSDPVIGLGGIDVRKVDKIKEGVSKCIKHFGRLDFLICGAAGNFICSVPHLSPNAFNSVISIDLIGSFNTVKACLPYLKQSKGSILFVSATLHFQGTPFQSHVGAAKAGIDALSNSLAVELGPWGIKSNCLAPGAIGNTEGFKRLMKPEYLANASERVPLQRLGTTRDIADTTVYIFSPEASYISGTVITVDGGLRHIGNIFNGEMYPKELIKDINRAKL